MLKALFVTISLFSFLPFASSFEYSPYGATIKNKKTGEMIAAKCNWLMDDKQTGKLICKDYRLILIDKNQNEIRELTKIKLYNPLVGDDYPGTSGTDEYIRSNLDFAKILINKMIKKELMGTKRDKILGSLETYYRSIGNYAINKEVSIHKTIGKYFFNMPAIIVSYPFFALLQGIDGIHAKYIFPKKLRKQSTQLFDSLKLVLTRHEKSVIVMKNKNFSFILNVLEN